MNPNDALLVTLVLAIVTGLLYAFLGYQLVVNQKQHWINGVDFTNLTDAAEFTKEIGRSLINGAGSIFVTALLLYFNVVGYVLFVLAFVVASCLPIIAFVKAKKKYA